MRTSLTSKLNFSFFQTTRFLSKRPLMSCVAVLTEYGLYSSLADAIQFRALWDLPQRERSLRKPFRAHQATRTCRKSPRQFVCIRLFLV